MHFIWPPRAGCTSSRQSLDLNALRGKSDDDRHKHARRSRSRKVNPGTCKGFRGFRVNEFGPGAAGQSFRPAACPRPTASTLLKTTSSSMLTVRSEGGGDPHIAPAPYLSHLMSGHIHKLASK